MTLAAVLVALAADAVVGDPDRIWRRWPHPVAWIGAAIAAADRRLNREAWSPRARKAAGTAAILALVAAAAAIGWAVQAALLAAGPWAGPALVGLAGSVLVAYRSLADHVGAVERAFGTGGLPAARRAVSLIVGRDPERLDTAGTARAAIESAAENFSDGVVAPVFWMAVAGLPGLLAYKTINTADSMIGHLSVRHRDFGWAAARIDDLANLLPARLAGTLLALASGARAGAAFRTMRRDAGLHRSPNAGWPESVMAGALGLALAGPRHYASGTVEDPFLNAEGRREAGPEDIGRALALLARAAVLHAGVYGVIWLVV